jgi:hypothetical protein
LPRPSRKERSPYFDGAVALGQFQGEGQRRSFHSGDEPLGVVIETVDSVQQSVGDGRRADIEVFSNAAG